jgi:hypothetical protein
MNSLSSSPEFVKGWNLFCQGHYIDDCTNDAQRAGFVAAFRKAEVL